MPFWKLVGNEEDFLCYSAQVTLPPTIHTHTHTHALLTKKAFGTESCPLRSSPFGCEHVNRIVNIPTCFGTKVWEASDLSVGTAEWRVFKEPSVLGSLRRDGLISKDEMMAYFLRAKSQLHCKMGPGFVHNFQEMTYLKPTFCEHCAGFVSLFFSVFTCM